MIIYNMNVNLNSGDNTFSYINNNYLINNNVCSFPITLINTNNERAVLTFINVIPITDVNTYFIIGNNNITINSSDITEHNVIITGVSNYLGLVQNGVYDQNGYLDIIIRNIRMNIISSSLSDNQGWICQSHFGIGVYDSQIIDCSSNGSISGDSCGGIAGSNFYGYINNCYSTGSISGNHCGGIIGSNANDSASENIECLIENSYSSGIISGIDCGGIFGFYANNGSTGGCKALNCYSSGAISGINSGGIFSSQTNNASSVNGYCIAENCYSAGLISGAQTGGIFGFGANYEGNGYCEAVNCYSLGDINSDLSGGIFGLGANSNASGYCKVITCYSLGTITGDNSGGIFGSNTNNRSSGYCEIINSYSTGSVNGNLAGGIIGSRANYEASGNCIVTNCYSIGIINGQNAGGIFGTRANSWGEIEITGKCLATNCYSIGEILGEYAGGIFGKEANYNSSNETTECVATNCYSTGDRANNTAGGIFGNNPNGGVSQDGFVKVYNCYSSGHGYYNGIFDSSFSNDNPNVNNIIGERNSSDSGGIWVNSNAIFTQSHLFGLVMSIENILIYLIPNENETNIPFLLLSFEGSLYSNVYSGTTTVGQYTTLNISENLGNLWYTNNDIILVSNNGQLTSNSVGITTAYIINGFGEQITNMYGYNINYFTLTVQNNNINNSNSILFKLVNTNNKKYLKRLKKYINNL